MGNFQATKFAHEVHSVTSDNPYFQSGLYDAMRIHARFSANIDRRLVSSGVSRTQRRILVELLQKPDLVDVQIADSLSLTQSFLSRTLKALINEGLVSYKPASRNRGQRHLFLTSMGKLEAERLRADLGKAITAELEVNGHHENNVLLASPCAVSPLQGCSVL